MATIIKAMWSWNSTLNSHIAKVPLQIGVVWHKRETFWNVFW